MDSPSLKAAKSNARAAARQKAAYATPELCLEWGTGMLHQLTDAPFWHSAKTILCFSSVFPEPDTRPLLECIWSEGKTLCLPRMTGEPGIMQAHLVSSNDSLVPGKFGIWEPDKKSSVCQPEKIDLILAPCVAASKDGTRLGHGGGFYDRFFARTNALRAVLCPSVLLEDSLPAGPLDLSMQVILTEEKILYPGSFHPDSDLL